MLNPWDEDEVIEAAPAVAQGNPWDADEIIGEPPGLEIDIVGGTPVPADQYDPTEGIGLYEQYRAGLGQSMVRGARGLRDLGTEVVRELAGDRTGLTDGDNTVTRWADRQIEAQQAQEEERRRLDAPLNAKPAAMLGNFVGTAAQLFTPGVALRGTSLSRAFLPTTVRGNAAQGGAFGLMQPTASDNERVQNAGIGAAVGGIAAKAMSAFGRMTPEAQQAEAVASKLGIKLKDAPGAQVEQASKAAGKFAQSEKGAALPGVASALRAERETARTAASGLYDQASNMDARVAVTQVGELAKSARTALDDFDVPAMPGIARRLNELEEVSGTRYATQFKLKAMERWRARVNTMSPKDGSPEQAAATVLKREYDGWLTRQFNDDMIAGRPEAVQAWREAKSAWSDYKQTFDANKVIRDLSRKDDLTQEQMRGWIFNASSLGAKRESGAIVARLNSILGPDSPQMQGLRSEVLFDISDPLLQKTPDIAKFVKNYDKFVVNNPTLRRELFPNGMGEFDDLVKLSRGIQKRPGAAVTPEHAKGIWDKVVNGITRYTFGHGIAQGGVRVRAATGIVDKIRQTTTGSSGRKAILREYLGADPKQPMFPTGTGPTALGLKFGNEPQPDNSEQDDR